jgi:organic hydroperoxide reductase OsmC/OhrA
MNSALKYRTVAWWSSGRTGLAKSDSAPKAIHFSEPPEYAGLEGRWTPEDLLLAALASCYTTTFRAIARNSKFVYTDLQVEVEGTVKKAEAGYAFSEIILRPTLTIHDEERRDRALTLLQKTKAACLVSKALATAPALAPHVKGW